MASMGEMIGNIAHQWRQPLSVISTIASGIMVQKEYGMFKEDHLVDDMDKIVKQTAHMSKTIEDFRDFFKSDKEKILFNVKDTIRQNIDLIEASFKNHNITIDPKINQDIELFGYQNELTQALINILNNAKDQLIKLDKEELKLVSIETIIQNNMVEINITDNGGGVPKDIIDKVFDPYFTTKHQSQGTGIGLYMTHEIIVKHFNGQLYVTNVDFTYENKTYTGARFTIALPMIKE
jgi:signal transduction histidine kinase